MLTAADTWSLKAFRRGPSSGARSTSEASKVGLKTIGVAPGEPAAMLKCSGMRRVGVTGAEGTAGKPGCPSPAGKPLCVAKGHGGGVFASPGWADAAGLPRSSKGERAGRRPGESVPATLPAAGIAALAKYDTH